MPPTPNPMSADETLEREAGPIRARLLDLAASLDRVDRATGTPSDPELSERIQAAIRLLLEPGRADRAERVQLLFSRDYVSGWRSRFAEGARAAEEAP